MHIFIEDIKSKVLSGHVICWTGTSAKGDFTVKLLTPEKTAEIYKCSPREWAPVTSETSYVKYVERGEPSDTVRSLLPYASSEFGLDRLASVLGVNIGGDCNSGACKMYEKIDSCTMSYDIETSTKEARIGGFPLVDSTILSIAAKCSCGDLFYKTTVDGSHTSSELVAEFVLHVRDHSPLWLIGWNCYGFDNECMRYHCPEVLKDLFMVSRIGAFGKPSYGSILNILGVYNVDALVYMKRAHYAMSSFKLADVAKSMNVTRKTEMPDMRNITSPEALMEYNVNDCVVVLDIWRKERLEEVIPSIALCSASPVYDCCRYVTGTMATNAYASYMHSVGKRIEWCPTKNLEHIEGGYVMEPVKGLHKNVSVCDFSSMYPTVMSSCNINPHDFSLTYCEHDMANGTVEVTENTTTVWLPGRRAIFNSSVKSDLATLMEYLVRERSKVKKTYPMYSKSLKVVANSVYGTIGYSKSWMYSPTCAAAITAVGRYCVNLAKSFFEAQNMTVLYMDTDSCMVTIAGSNDKVTRTAERSLAEFHAYSSTKSIREMCMVVEEYFPKSIMLQKKKYCMLRSDNSMKIVGVSIARKDVSQLCKEAARTCLRSLFEDDRNVALDSMSRFINGVKQMAVHQHFTLADVSKYTRKDGVWGYQYNSVDKTIVFVPEKEAVLMSPVLCDIDKVLSAVSKEMERFSVPCGYGGVREIMMSSGFF